MKSFEKEFILKDVFYFNYFSFKSGSEKDDISLYHTIKKESIKK